jgi:hypothetical protein
MKRILWWACLLLALAVLTGLELFHPSNFTAHPGMHQYLSQAAPHSAAHHHALDYFGPRWWLVLHMIQTPSSAAFAALAFIAAALLLWRRAGWPTWRCWQPSAGSCRPPMLRRTARSPSRS